MLKTIIIGNSFAAYKTAAKIKRLDSHCEVILLDSNSCNLIDSCGLNPFLAGDIQSLDLLNVTGWGQTKETYFFENIKGIKVISNCNILEINTEEKKLMFSDSNNTTICIEYDNLVLEQKLVPNEQFKHMSPLVDSFNSAEDFKRIKELFQKGKVGSCIIFGKSSRTIEIAQAVSDLWGIETTLVSPETHLMSSYFDNDIATLSTNCMKDNGLNVILNSIITNISYDNENQVDVALSNGNTLNADLLILCDRIYDQSLAIKAGLEMNNEGKIVIYENGYTSKNDIWTLIESENTNEIINQIDVVAFAVAGIPFKHSVSNHFGIKLYEKYALSTGINEQKAENNGIKFKSVSGVWNDKADFLPDKENIFAKLIYEPDTHQLLGLQIFGSSASISLINSFSLLLEQKARLEDLYIFDSVFIPGYSSGNILKSLASLALNADRLGIKIINRSEINSNHTIIDVRTKDEIKNNPVEFSTTEIEINQLKKSLIDFDKNTHLVLLCQKGSRAFEAARICHNSSFKNLYVIGGGAIMYNEINKFEV